MPHDDTRMDRRDDKPVKHEVKVTGTVTHNVVVVTVDDGSQARINSLVARLKASNDALAAAVAAHQPKE